MSFRSLFRILRTGEVERFTGMLRAVTSWFGMGTVCPGVSCIRGLGHYA